MPSSPSGTSDAVAIKAGDAHKLNSAYTILLDHVVLLLWGLSVISGLLVYIRIYKARHPHDSFSRALWAKRASPYSILKLTIKHLWETKNREWWILLWVFLALGFIVMKYAIPIVFASYIIIDNAAPVAAQAIFVPSNNGVTSFGDPTTILDVFALEVPAALRAVGNIVSVNSTIFPTALITVDQPEILAPDPSTNDPNQRINYRYVVTGQDFGLQNYPDLILNVEGSCVTDYSWYQGPAARPGDPNITEDVYWPYSNSALAVAVSLIDGPAPVISEFVVASVNSSGPPSNITWGAIISSMNRGSYYSSDDPWYMTLLGASADSSGNFTVKMGRPALSCWQNDRWSYRGSNSSILNLTAIALPGLELPLALQSLFAHYLGLPKVPVLGQQLGLSALQSTSTFLDGVFNASSSSLYNDLQRLVFASYIATVNTLTETTLYPTNSNVQNDILVRGQIPVGVDEFVIWSQDVITLSVKALIVIPVLTVVLWIIFIAVLLLPLKPIQALKELRAHGASAHENSTNDTAAYAVPAVGKPAHNIVVEQANEEEGEEKGKKKEKDSPAQKVVSTAASLCGSLDSNANPGNDANDFV